VDTDRLHRGKIPHQDQVDSYFQSAAGYWDEVYHSGRLRPLIYQRRRDVALAWIAELRLPPAARVLDIGCGAGALAAALAAAGYLVDAIDTTPAMVQMTRRHAGARVHVAAGDAHALAFAAGRFDVVAALGVLPWLDAEGLALGEIYRVLKPGGYLLLTADNEYRLARLLDPLSTPPLAPLRRIAKAIVRGAAPPSAPMDKRHRPADVLHLLALFRMVELRSATLGFGPLTLFGRDIFSDGTSVRIDRFLAALAARGCPGLQTTGAHYLVLAQKGE
jgi:ubiquinone/menaquinone biosynthesis C-methylase UbiE